jgi:hypothetical protein
MNETCKRPERAALSEAADRVNRYRKDGRADTGCPAIPGRHRHAHFAPPPAFTAPHKSSICPEI